MTTALVDDLSDICRTCLSKSTHLVPLTAVIDEENLNIKDYLKRYMQLDCIETDYRIPKNICLKCFQSLLDVRNYFLQCQESEKYLKLKVSLPHPIKKQKVEIKYEIHNDNDIDTTADYLENVDKDDNLDNNLTDDYEYEINVFENIDYLLEKCDDLDLKIENLDENSETLKKKQENSIEKSQKYDEKYECIICVVCHSKFSSWTEFDIHKCTINGLEEPETVKVAGSSLSKNITSNCHHKCVLCISSFQSLSYLYLHIINAHKAFILENYNITAMNKLSIGCSICNKQYTPKKQKRTSCKKINRRKNLLCELCGKVYHSPQSMKEHEFAHKGIKPYKCEYCGREFAQECVKRQHVKLHTGKDINCSLCDKTFATKSYLRIHMTYHTNDLQFPCDMCTKRFRRNYALQLHRKKSHIGTKTEQCEYCDACFAIKDDLGDHIRAVHLKPYCCNLCTNRYSEPGRLRQHFLKIHNIEMLDVSYCKKKKTELEILNRSKKFMKI